MGFVGEGLSCVHGHSVEVSGNVALGAECCGVRSVWSLAPVDHITSLLKQLHWLSVHQRVVFKITWLVHQSLAGVVPLYLADDFLLFSECGRRSLRSSSNDIRTVVVPRTQNKSNDKFLSCCGTFFHQNVGHHSCHLTVSGVI